jgi:glycosyltransferase involved in cell wall biosynthesis
MSAAPKVSAVIPVHNRSHCIGQALQSILDQSVRVHEIIVVDDGSEDDLEGALAFAARRVTLVRHPSNLGAAAARNTGIGEASGDYIAFLDSDDTWKPEKLRLQLDFMQCASFEAACTGFELVEAKGAGAAAVAWRPYPEAMRIEDYVWGCYTSPGSTLVARRSLLQACGGYDPSMPRYEDWDLLLRLVERSPNGVGFLNEPLATIRRGSNPRKQDVLVSLDRLIERHHHALLKKNSAMARKLRSGVAFNRAAAYAADRDWPATARELIRSFLLAPVGNWPLQVILRERLSK